LDKGTIGQNDSQKLTKKISKFLELRAAGMSFEFVKVFMTLTRLLISMAGSSSGVVVAFVVVVVVTVDVCWLLLAAVIAEAGAGVVV
jgi:fatty-acid desaturase